MTGNWPDKELDHINGHRHDNRWSNLRESTDRQNAANRKRQRNNTSGFKGVHRDGNRWRARIASRIGPSISVGRFDTSEEAHTAYLAAAKERFGEFANGG
jgi:hypothetical protein